MLQEGVVKLVQEQVKLCGGSQKTVAFNLGISPQYLNDVLKYRREPGPKILKALGLVKKVTYEEKTDTRDRFYGG